MADTLSKKIKKHLEFIGYTIEDIPLKDKAVVAFMATHDKRGNSLCKVINNKFTLISTRWSGFKKKLAHDKKALIAINELNLDTFFGKWIWQESDGESTLIFESVYEGYEKTTFGTFLDELDREMFSKLPELNEFGK